MPGWANKNKRKRGNPFEYEFSTENIGDESLCEMCDEPWHDKETCQCISLRRIADALEKIAGER